MSHRRDDKLYLVTHSDLSPGYQVAQIAHAVADFAVSHPEHFATWHQTSQYIIALRTEDADSLTRLHEQSQHHGLKTQPFYEPDLDNQLTALAFIPEDGVSTFLSHLPLAGKTSTSNTSRKA